MSLLVYTHFGMTRSTWLWDFRRIFCVVQLLFSSEPSTRNSWFSLCMFSSVYLLKFQHAMTSLIRNFMVKCWGTKIDCEEQKGSSTGRTLKSLSLSCILMLWIHFYTRCNEEQLNWWKFLWQFSNIERKLWDNIIRINFIKCFQFENTFYLFSWLLES